MCNSAKMARRRQRRTYKTFWRREAISEISTEPEPVLDYFTGDEVANEVLETAPLVRHPEEEKERARWLAQNPYAGLTGA